MGRLDINADSGTFQSDLIQAGYQSPVKFRRRAISFASDANKTLANTEYDGLILDLTSAVSLTATRNLVVPVVEGAIYVVKNGTSGSQSVQVIGATGTGITIANGKTAIVWCDGTNWLRLTADNP